MLLSFIDILLLGYLKSTLLICKLVETNLEI